MLRNLPLFTRLWYHGRLKFTGLEIIQEAMLLVNIRINAAKQDKIAE